MKVAAAKATAARWVERYARNLVTSWTGARPGSASRGGSPDGAARVSGALFRGAYFSGSVMWMADDAELPPNSDVDVTVVIGEPAGTRGAPGDVPKLGKFRYDGVLLEVSFLPESRLDPAEEVLASYHLANGFRVDTVIADPSGRLRGLHEFVAPRFAEPAWVRRRCTDALRTIEARLAHTAGPTRSTGLRGPAPVADPPAGLGDRGGTRRFEKAGPAGSTRRAEPARPNLPVGSADPTTPGDTGGGDVPAEGSGGPAGSVGPARTTAAPAPNEPAPPPASAGAPGPASSGGARGPATPAGCAGPAPSARPAVPAGLAGLPGAVRQVGSGGSVAPDGTVSALSRPAGRAGSEDAGVGSGSAVPDGSAGSPDAVPRAGFGGSATPTRAVTSRSGPAGHAGSAVTDVARSERPGDTPSPAHVTAWLFATGGTTHVLLVAARRNPTVRLRYLAVRDVLAEHGHAAFYPRLLDLLGAGQVTRRRAQHHLDALARTFDATAAVARTPFFFSSDITVAAGNVAVDGSQELIGRGDHREAMFWIVATFARCHTILAVDAPDLVARFAPGFRDVLAELGIGSGDDLRRRAHEVAGSLPDVWAVAESIVGTTDEPRTVSRS